MPITRVYSLHKFVVVVGMYSAVHRRWLLHLWSTSDRVNCCLHYIVVVVTIITIAITTNRWCYFICC